MSPGPFQPIALAVKVVESDEPLRPVVTKTSKAIGYTRTRLQDGPERLIAWLRRISRLG